MYGDLQYSLLLNILLLKFLKRMETEFWKKEITGTSAGASEVHPELACVRIL